MATRSRKDEIKYKKYRKTLGSKDECQFCEIDASSSQLVLLTDNFKIIRNIFKYSVWDSYKVSDHLMVTPNQHTDTLADIPATAAVEFVQLISRYEQDGYNIYARAPVSGMKSVVHQHTHMIKPKGKRIRAVIHTKKPYIRIVV